MTRRLDRRLGRMSPKARTPRPGFTTEPDDIRVMSGWLRSWQVEVPTGGVDMGHDMPGMISKTQILALEGRSGADFDRLWLSVLAKHLDAGVAMAEKVAGSGAHQGTKDLAEKIVTTRRAQIEQIVDRLP
ncbi:hypothetical protein GCM10023193_53250 [Planotetraspora kaengkrachanensis]|uniref:DUF305 domain-containing protein n=2 Tax=Planotetraspora kaengkrachanensis TaxID=575193 RepID=A0A8J3PU39_9ACTN|nr:hypothetical protein Pka01_42100 [Planotetraspora kaengkrachanensis]